LNLSESAEEVLEKLWISLVEKEEESVSKKFIGKDDVFIELLNNKLIAEDKKGIRLTTKGKDVAEGVIRRHRLAERLFHDLLRMNKRNMESPACQFEHLLISGDVEEGVCTLLGHPKECPHGRRIPKGRCCRERRQRAGKVIHPLSELKNGQKGEVIYLQTQDKNLLKKLMAMGVLPGRKIQLIQRSPSYVFSIGRTQVVVDKEIASNIYVRTG
jgi:DtxR family Mn-dependent transcriptional regulator